MMWVLFIIILVTTPEGQYPAYQVAKYHEYKECAPAADALYKSLQKTYPGTDYTVQCVHTSKTTA